MSLDDVLRSLSESLQVTKQADHTARPHPKYNQWRELSLEEEAQRKRRKEFFDNQQKNRDQVVMKLRSLVNEKEDDLTQPMDTKDDTKQSSKRNKFYVNRYKNQLMLSEWLVTMPEDFASDWILVLCPIGKRCLVVSGKGQTKAYSRTGYLMATFPSTLPGGNRKGRDCKQHCIMDCVFSESQRIYYVLDVMEWNGQYFHDCDTEFRFFWLHSKLETENPEVSLTSNLNRCPFLPLKRYSCDRSDIESALKQQLFPSSALDGLLFYHKKSFYTPGVTPLVNWLKPHMVADVLKIAIES